MKANELFALLGTAISLLLVSAAIHAFALWSALANFTVPWFCSTLALAILILVIIVVLTGRAANNIPKSLLLAVWSCSSLIIGLGMIVDDRSYILGGDKLASVGEWLGFTVILGGVMWISRCRPNQPEKS